MVKVLGLNAYPVPTAPDAYDIVQVAFPYREAPCEPGPKLRPCLVLSKSVHRERVTGNPYATLQVAYGTSRKPRRINPWDMLHVHNYEALYRSGLSKTTFFVLGRIQKLMWCEEFFPVNQSFETPILGRLPQDHILTLNKTKEIRDELRRSGMS